jgi:trk system potassium uptake protein TrkH
LELRRGLSASAKLQWAWRAALLALVALDFGWPVQPALSFAVLGTLTALLLPWGWLLVHGARAQGSALRRLEVWLFRLVLLCLAALVLGAKWWLLLGARGAELAHFSGSSRSYGVALLLILTLGFVANGIQFSKVVGLVADHPARLVAASFAATGLAGGFLLSLPLSLQRVHELSMLDNMFMAFSAVCVTGLAVNTVSDTYTLFGQGVLCLLIQVGGLGIMVLSAAFAVITGQRMRVKSSAMIAEMVDAESLAKLRRVMLGIVGSTLLIEALAASALYLQFSRHPELLVSAAAPAVGTRTVVWAAIFHAVSAFCNAGFSNLPSGLVPFVGETSVMGTVTALVVLGGIGFPVIYELAGRFGRWVRRRRRERMSLHSRIALRATALLLPGMALAYLALEWAGALGHLDWFESIVSAIFQAASCRTAGFNVIDVGAMRPASLMLTCVAMFIGGAPGSCAGGIKVTTVAVLFAGLRSELQGRPAYLLDRALAPATLRKAVGVAFLSIGMLSVALFLLLLLEKQAPLDLAFEAFSAFSTTGLSTGVTPLLGSSGKLLVLLTMYIGRIGPLTLAMAISIRAETPRVQLPNERVLIG